MKMKKVTNLFWLLVAIASLFEGYIILTTGKIYIFKLDSYFFLGNFKYLYAVFFIFFGGAIITSFLRQMKFTRAVKNQISLFFFSILFTFIGFFIHKNRHSAKRDYGENYEFIGIVLIVFGVFFFVISFKNIYLEWKYNKNITGAVTSRLPAKLSILANVYNDKLWKFEIEKIN